MKIVLDIETLAPTKEAWAALQGIPFDPSEEGGLFQDFEAAQREREYQRAAFDGTFSRIVCVGLIALKDDLTPINAEAWYGENEKEILTRFWRRMAKDRPRQIITFNGLGFDLPFIKKRSVIHQVKPGMEINLARFRTEPVYDVMAVWANWDNRAWIRLDVLARALGVGSKSGSGGQVAEMWQGGKKKEVAEYCLQDVYVTYGCFCRMSFEEPLDYTAVLSRKELHLLD
jgi:DNA polymerase elongation subunit (family B)